MYKVFINDKPIIFTRFFFQKKYYLFFKYKNIDIYEIVFKLKIGKLKGVILLIDNFNTDWKNFLSHFHVISSAGGLVINNKKEYLFIYRYGRWDLPKGRIEKNETTKDAAIREVEEECGILNLEIDKFIIKTYHIFFVKNKAKIKQTYWYLMKTTFNGFLTPQKEEGISQAVFKNKIKAIEALKKSYANIRLVCHDYFN